MIHILLKSGELNRPLPVLTLWDPKLNQAFGDRNQPVDSGRSARFVYYAQTKVSDLQITELRDCIRPPQHTSSCILLFTGFLHVLSCFLSCSFESLSVCRAQIRRPLLLFKEPFFFSPASHSTLTPGTPSFLRPTVRLSSFR